MKHARGGRVNRARMHRHTQSNKVWETCRVMCLVGAIRGCGFFFTKREQISWVCLVEKGRSHNPEHTAGYFHSAGLINSPVAQPRSLCASCVHFFQRFEAGPGEEANSCKHKKTQRSSRKTSTQNHEGQSEERGRKVSGQEWWEIPAMCFSFLLPSMRLSLSLPLPFSSSFYFMSGAFPARECEEEGGRSCTTLLLWIWLIPLSAFSLQLFNHLVCCAFGNLCWLYSHRHDSNTPEAALIVKLFFYLILCALLLFIQILNLPSYFWSFSHLIYIMIAVPVSQVRMIELRHRLG